MGKQANFRSTTAVNQEMQSHGGAVLNSHYKIFAVVAAMARLVPAAASAKRPEGKGEKGNKHEATIKLASANVKGVVTANDGTTLTVMVDKASGHAKACKG